MRCICAVLVAVLASLTSPNVHTTRPLVAQEKEAADLIGEGDTYSRLMDALVRYGSVLENEDGTFTFYADGETNDRDLARASQAVSLLPEVTRVELGYNNSNLTDKGAATLADCKQLESIVFNNCSGVNGTCFQELGKLKHLKSLSLQDTPTLEGTFSGFPSLETLYLNSSLSAEFFRSVSRLPQLKNFVCYGSLEETYIVEAANSSGFQSLESLRLNLEEDEEEEANDILALKRLPNLRSLSIHSSLTAVDLAAVAELKSLTALELWDGLWDVEAQSYVRGLASEESVATFIAPLYAMRQLKSLVVENSVSFDSLSLRSFRSFEHLEKLDLNLRCNSLQDAISISQTLGKFTNLKELDVDYRPFTDECLKALAPLTKLESLNLSRNRSLSDSGIATLASFKSLRVLSLSGCQALTDEGFKHLANLTRLEQLNLSGCYSLTSSGLQIVAAFKQLEQLYIEECFRVGDEGLKHLSGLQNLKDLGLAFTTVTDAGLQSLVNCKELRELDLRHCHGVTGSGLKALTNTKLSRLDLEYIYQLSDEGLEALATLPRLTSIDLEFSPSITDKGVIALGAAPYLRALKIVGNDKITDDALRALADLQYLKVLRLTYMPEVTDRGAIALFGIETLTELSFTYCPKVTSTVMDAFEELRKGRVYNPPEEPESPSEEKPQRDGSEE